MQLILFAQRAIILILRNKYWNVILHQFTKELDINVVFVMKLWPTRIHCRLTRSLFITNEKKYELSEAFILCLKLLVRETKGIKQNSLNIFGKLSVPRRHQQNSSDMQYVLQIFQKINNKFWMKK